MTVEEGQRVNACKTLVDPKNARSATRFIRASRFELPLLGSNQDSPDPESGVLPVTPRGTYKPFVFRFRTVRWGTTLHVVIASSDTGSMELRGLEPLTSWVRSRRSPS